MDTVLKKLPSTQEKLGDDKLEQARHIMNESGLGAEYASLIGDRIAQRLQIPIGVFRNSNAPGDIMRLPKEHRGKTHESQRRKDIYNRLISTARSLYSGLLSCKGVFLSPDMKEELANVAWNVAQVRESYYFRPDRSFICSNMELFTNIKNKIRRAVASSYEFDTSRALDGISRNATHAQALLTKMTSIYRELNFGRRPYYPYRHPIIQKVINITWFSNKNDVGIHFRDYFAPIPIEAIAVALAVIECCIDEWSDGTWKLSSWSEKRYNAIYLSHLNSLHDLSNHGHHQQGGDLLAQIQYDLLKDALLHANSPLDPDSITGYGGLPIEGLDNPFQGGYPGYNQIPLIRFTET